MLIFYIWLWNMANYQLNAIVDNLIIIRECQRNYRAASRLYQQIYPTRRIPNVPVIIYIEKRAQTGNLRRQQRKHTLTHQNNNAWFPVVLAIVYENSTVSLREIQRKLGVPKSTVSRYLKGTEFHPYHITIKQSLRGPRFCQWVTQQINNDCHFLKHVTFNDEATFRSDGTLNRHNCHDWSDINPLRIRDPKYLVSNFKLRFNWTLLLLIIQWLAIAMYTACFTRFNWRHWFSYKNENVFPASWCWTTLFKSRKRLFK